MRLRIIAGELGGRYLTTPRGRETRPTREAVREAWFNALGDVLRGGRVLDLFAGSGALGIEALSRGAKEAHFVESSRSVARTLRGNLRALGLLDRAFVESDDVFRYLARIRGARPPYDVAFADPPYGSGAGRRVAELLKTEPFARLLCVEHEPGALEETENAVWRRRYGDTELTFLVPR